MTQSNHRKKLWQLPRLAREQWDAVFNPKKDMLADMPAPTPVFESVIDSKIDR